jgi:hypothetical protein
MTRDSVRERGARPIESGLPVDPATLVVILIVLGVLLRAVIGGIYLPYSGFRIDVGDFSAWAQRLASGGPAHFYAPDYFGDYPPGYMYVLWLLGSIGDWLRPLTGVLITGGLVKVPGILADAGVAWLLFSFARRFGHGWLGSWSGERLGLVAAVIYLFNPGTIFNSSVWGQVDSVGTLAALGTIYLLARGWTEAAAVGAVIALLVKFQFGFLVPIVAIVGVKRHLFGRSSDPLLDGRPAPVRVLSSVVAGLGSLVLLILPFGFSVWSPADPGRSLVGKFLEAADTYRGLTINGFNLWRNPFSGLGNTLQWGCDVAPPTCGPGQGVAFTLGTAPITWQLVGTLLFAAAAMLAFWQVARRDDPRGLLVGALVLAVAFFALPTRVHERYLFPALAIGALLVARSWRWAALYAVLSVSFFANVYWVYTADWSFAGSAVMNPGVGGKPMPRDPLLSSLVFNDTGIYLLSFVIVLALAWLLVQSARMALAAEEAVPAVMPPVPPPVWEPELPAVAAVSAPIEADPAAAEHPVAPGVPWSDRLPAWLRRDPDDPYAGEPTRRVDRLDLALVIAFVLVAFFFRLWRLDIPRHTHFDEVYHARSATEWLSDWQEGWTRDTYEWTHPPLAKYLIAAGIVFADPNKVVGGTDLAAPATALAVAPQRTAFSRPASIAFTSDGSPRIEAHEVLSGKLVSTWNAPGQVASLAYDEDGNRLLVGLADSGSVSVYDLKAFLARLGERGPPPAAAQLETGLAGVTQIVVPSGSVIICRGPDGIAELERDTGVPVATSTLVASGIGFVPATGSGDAATDSRVVAIDPARQSLVVLDGATLKPDTKLTGADGEIPLVGKPAGPILVQGSGSSLQIWVPLGALPANDEHGPVQGGVSVFDEKVGLIDTVALPGTVVGIGWQEVANIVYVVGHEHGSGAPVAWAVQPLGNGGTQRAGFATFDTTALPGDPLAIGFDFSDNSLSDDHSLDRPRQHGPAGLDRRRQQRLRVADRRRRLRGAPGRDHLPLRRHALLAAPDRGIGGGLSDVRWDELRDEPDRHERHLRGDLHPGRLRGLLADLVRPMGPQRLVGAAAGRDPDRPRHGDQVGRHLRPHRPVGPGPGPIALWPIRADRGDWLPDDRGRAGRPMAVPGRLRACAAAGPGAGLEPADPPRGRRPVGDARDRGRRGGRRAALHDGLLLRPGTHAKQRRRVPVRLPGAGRAGRLAGLDHARRGRPADARPRPALVARAGQ